MNNDHLKAEGSDAEVRAFLQSKNQDGTTPAESMTLKEKTNEWFKELVNLPTEASRDPSTRSNGDRMLSRLMGFDEENDR